MVYQSLLKATFTDSELYAAITARITAQQMRRNVLSLDKREAAFVDITRERYTDTFTVFSAVQRILDAESGIHIRPKEPGFDTGRAHKIGHSLEDQTVPDSTIERRALSATENFCMSHHDDCVRTQAEFRARAGLQSYAIREGGAKCCDWCADVSGKYPANETPAGFWGRHDNCKCSILYESKRGGRQLLRGTSKKWEQVAPGAGAEPLVRLTHEQALAAGAGDPVVFTKEQAAAAGAGAPVNFIGKEILQKDLTILQRNGTIKAEGSAFDAFNRKIGSSDLTEDLKAVNPYFEKGTPYGKNCQRCVPTFVLRRRGYNVTALPSGNAQIDDFLMNFPEAVWKKSGSPIIPKHTRGSKYFGKPEIEKFMKELPDGAMCEVRCQWVDEENGHVFIALKENNKVRYIDPQIGSDDVSYYFSKMKANKTTFWRIDDATIDENLIPYCCE